MITFSQSQANHPQHYVTALPFEMVVRTNHEMLCDYQILQEEVNLAKTRAPSDHSAVVFLSVKDAFDSDICPDHELEPILCPSFFVLHQLQYTSNLF